MDLDWSHLRTLSVAEEYNPDSRNAVTLIFATKICYLRKRSKDLLRPRGRRTSFFKLWLLMFAFGISLTFATNARAYKMVKLEAS